MRSSTLALYYQLTKPGIIYGNMLTALGGFLLASKGQIAIGRLLAAVAGMSLIIASACVVNNYIDRGIDQKMARTKKRALATGRITAPAALTYAAVLGVLGFVVTGLWVNSITLWLGVLAFVDYVVLYGIAKRRTVHGTLVGSVAGALPVTAGYTAVTGNLDLGAALLFSIMTLWQMPHFYAIALFRMRDYAAAHIPVLPLHKSPRAAKRSILVYIVAFALVAPLLTVVGVTGYTYALGMLALSVAWFVRGYKGLAARDDAAWARGMFGFSLKVLLGFSALIALDVWLP